MYKILKLADLVDIRTIAVDMNLTKRERIIEFIRQIKDPYHYRCGKWVVRTRYLDRGPTLEASLIRMTG